jgi:hypothetical protein
VLASHAHRHMFRASQFIINGIEATPDPRKPTVSRRRKGGIVQRVSGFGPGSFAPPTFLNGFAPYKSPPCKGGHAEAQDLAQSALLRPREGHDVLPSPCWPLSGLWG